MYQHVIQNVLNNVKASTGAVGGPARQRRPAERELGSPDFTSPSPSTGGSQPEAHTGRPPGHGAGVERRRVGPERSQPAGTAPGRVRFREHISDTRPQTQARREHRLGRPLQKRCFKWLIDVLSPGCEEALFSYVALGLFPGFGRGPAGTPASLPLCGATLEAPLLTQRVLNQYLLDKEMSE